MIKINKKMKKIIEKVYFLINLKVAMKVVRILKTIWYKLILNSNKYIFNMKILLDIFLIKMKLKIEKNL